MLKKTITYTDFNGNRCTEDAYFNLTRAELMDMEMSTSGGMKNKLDQIVATQDNVELYRIFREILMKAYGIKSPDGKRFMKSPEIAEAFTQSAAFDEFFVELMSDTENVVNFINAIIPGQPEPKLTGPVMLPKA